MFIDKASGKLARRPELDKALLVVRERDQLVVAKLDRLGRSLEHLINLSKSSNPTGLPWLCSTRALTPPPLLEMFFHILSAIAEFEHSLTSERTLDSLEAARA